LENLLSVSDVISLHLPLNEATRNLIDAEMLRLVKPSALLVNTSRGGVVDEQALYETLAGGRLAGAACDVFAQEPPAGSPLLALDNFVATPHLGLITKQTTLRVGRMAAENALAALRGERPASVVNPEVYEKEKP
jgi:phosphoglycerate dehydrogenase-like enzyme